MTLLDYSLIHIFYFLTHMPLKQPSAAREKDSDPSKKMFTVSRLPSLLPLKWPSGTEQCWDCVRNHSSAWSYKSFLVWVEVHAPGASIKEMPQWRSVPESRKPIRITGTTILSVRYCLNMLLVEDRRGGERVLDREIKGYVENIG